MIGPLRRIWATLGGKIAILACAGGIVLGLILAVRTVISSDPSVPRPRGSGESASAAPDSPSVTSSPTPSATAGLGNQDPDPTPARGCLDLDPNRGILAAIDSPLTPRGAAEFAGAYYRWGSQLPYPSGQSPAEIGKKVWDSSLSEEGRKIGQWGPEYAGYQGYLSLVNGKYEVETFEPGRSASIKVMGTGVITSSADGSKTQNIHTTLDLRVVDGHWRVTGSRLTEMTSAAKPYQGGC